jgi:hypothetical protein
VVFLAARDAGALFPTPTDIDGRLGFKAIVGPDAESQTQIFTEG